ncbi:MAG: hypothetical protein ACE5D8_01140 [Fidelibacterota bacterium]
MNKLISFAAMSLLWLGCDNYSDETFTINAIDEQACQIFETDTLFNQVSSHWIPDSVADASGKIDSLLSLGAVVTVNPDSLWKIGKTDDTTFVVLSQESNGTVILYTNLNVNVTVYDASGTEQQYEPVTLDLETIAACNEIVGRKEYVLTAGQFLVRLAMEEGRGFKMIVLNKE